MVVFEIAEQIYAFEINRISEIIRLHKIVPVPEASKFFSGLISLREKSVPVIDLRQRLGFPMGEASTKERIIILDMEGLLVGIKVDAVLEVMALEEKDFEPISLNTDVSFIKGIGQWEDDLILLLDGSKLFLEEVRSIKG